MLSTIEQIYDDFIFFFFNDTATTEIYTLSLHDALPISFQRQLMARVRGNLAELDGQLVLRSVLSRLELEGGWYAVLRVPATRSDEELTLVLLDEKGVYVHPGHYYDFSSDGYLVVSLICE